MDTIRISVPIPALLVHVANTAAQAPGRVGSMLAVALVTALDWRARATERRSLAELDDRMLRDLGLTRGDVYKECRKHFWEV
jgi:uncharacterized protein YjiS (DUF1127 family)